MKKIKKFFHYIKTHKFTVLLRMSLFCICISLAFTILFGLLERDGVFNKPQMQTPPTPTETIAPDPTPIIRDTDKYVSVNMGKEPMNLNSILAQDSVTTTILRHMLEGLVRLDPAGTPVPAVATTWLPSEDNLTWTFTLREDSLWQDGTRVVAGDFKATIDLHLDPETASPYRTQMETLFAAVETPDDNTIIFTLKEANAEFPKLLAETQFMPIQKALYEANPNLYGIDPATICYNGPWYVVLWTHNQRIVMLKNHTYWNAEQIALEQLIFISSGTASSKFSNFKAGNYDLVFLSSLEADSYRAENYTVVDYPDGAVVSLSFNNDNAKLQSAALRRALSLSIDRTAFVNDVLKTGATAIEGYDITVDLPLAQEALQAYYLELVPQPTPTPEAEPTATPTAEPTVAPTAAPVAASVPTLTLTITVDESEASILYASALAQQWQEHLGLQVTVEQLSYADRIEKIQKGTMEISITISNASATSLEAPLYYRHTLYATNQRIQNIISTVGRDLDFYYATPVK